MLPTKFQVNWLLGLGVEANKRFSRWPLWRPSWISDQQDFSYFYSASPWYFLPSLYSTGLSAQEMKWKIDFPDGGHGSHIGFPIGTILAIFDLQVSPMLPTKFWVNWHLGLLEEANNRFSRWPPWRPSWIYDWHNFSYFWFTSHPNASYQVLSQLTFLCRRRIEK